MTAVRMRLLTHVLTETAIEREAERIRELLPPLPGRKWAVDRATALLSRLANAALARSSGEGLGRTVVAEVDHRASLGRTKTRSAGLGVSAILGAMPEANDVLICMARRHGVTVTDH